MHGVICAQNSNTHVSAKMPFQNMRA
jgi:hypothetical protein